MITNPQALGVYDSALNWFALYLSPDTQSVYVNDHILSSTFLTCGVPQVSMRDNLLFTLYTG